MSKRFRPPISILLVTVGVVLVATACSSAGGAPLPPPGTPATETCAPSVPRAGATATRAFVCIDTPPVGGAVGRAITITGRAANAGAYRVSVELLDASGLIATRGETELPGAHTPSRVDAWHITLNVPATVQPGRLTLVARAFDTSQRTFGEDDVAVTLQPTTATSR
jgi:hypothetical protein